MDNQASRRRASSAAISKTDALELQNQLQIFNSLSQDQDDKNPPNYQHLIHAGHSIRHILFEKSNSYRAQETFRHLGGFQAIITASENIFGAVELRENDIQEHELIQDLIQTVFGVLTAALHEHKGNQKHFQLFHPGGGWQILGNLSKMLIEHLKKKKNLAFSQAIIERLFGCLLSCATNDDTMAELFGKLRRKFQDVSSPKSTDMSK